MAIGKALVSYDSIVKPFPDKQTLLARIREQAGKVIADPARADSLVSQLSDALDAMQEAQGNHPQVMHTPRNTMGSLLQTHVAQHAVQENKFDSFLMKGVDFVLEVFEVKFSAEDFLGWAASFFTWIEGILPAKWPAPPPEATTIGNNFRVGLLGDWGTGLYGAPSCANSIEADPDGYDLVLHLGDVYYSGLDTEIEERFLNYNLQNGNWLTRSLNGNHEMYTGGHGYFELLLPQLKQTASCFAFQNDYWTLIALDTAYNQPLGGQEGKLDPDGDAHPQIDWVNKIVAAAGNRKIALFGHHQPFSQFDSQGPILINELRPLLESKRFAVWYWGHEHRCVLYDAHPSYGVRGRCVGHGGFPEARVDLSNAPYSNLLGSQWRELSGKGAGDSYIPGGLALDANNPFIPGFETQFEPHGFMRLQFENERLTEYVRSPAGANLYLEDLGWSLTNATSGGA